jgi:single-stranded DNA-binding protein
MLKMTVTKAVISKGFNGEDALKFSENTDNQFVRFRIGVRVYDKKAKDEHRFVNLNVKAFGYIANRIKDMNLDAGTYINLVGRYDEDSWEDKNTHEKKSAPILIAEEIEFASSGGNSKQNSNGAATAPAYGGYGTPPAATPIYSGQSQPQYGGYSPQPQPGNFTGYENFGGNNPYFPES